MNLKRKNICKEESKSLFNNNFWTRKWQSEVFQNLRIYFVFFILFLWVFPLTKLYILTCGSYSTYHRFVLQKYRQTGLLSVRYKLLSYFLNNHENSGQNYSLIFLFSCLLLLVVQGTLLVMKLLFLSSTCYNLLCDGGAGNLRSIFSSPAGSCWVLPIGDGRKTERQGDTWGTWSFLVIYGYHQRHSSNDPLVCVCGSLSQPPAFPSLHPEPVCLIVPHQNYHNELGSIPFHEGLIPAQCDISWF